MTEHHDPSVEPTTADTDDRDPEDNDGDDTSETHAEMAESDTDLIEPDSDTAPAIDPENDDA